jgi:hypothetical protein
MVAKVVMYLALMLRDLPLYLQESFMPIKKKTTSPPSCKEKEIWPA